jgi:hypothetical protein
VINQHVSPLKIKTQLHIPKQPLQGQFSFIILIYYFSTRQPTAMKKIFIPFFFIGFCITINAQYETVFHPSSFKKFKGLMRSNSYKADAAEKQLLGKITTALFPSDIKKNPPAYIDTPIHWIGIVKDVIILDSNNSSTVLFTLEQKYWDYIEDYSIQDEVMFLSPEGEGEFHAVVQLTLTDEEKQKLRKLPDEQTLFFCYGTIIADNTLPAMKATYIKTVDYKYYSTKIFSYKIKRDDEGRVVTDKVGRPQPDDLKFLKVAGRGQNKD